jgi:hypothetical protein
MGGHGGTEEERAVLHTLAGGDRRMPEGDRIDVAFGCLCEEIVRSVKMHGNFQSRHEAYAVLLEELDELWDEIKSARQGTDCAEALQVAAMALRYFVEFGGAG